MKIVLISEGIINEDFYGQNKVTICLQTIKQLSTQILTVKQFLYQVILSVKSKGYKSLKIDNLEGQMLKLHSHLQC